ncbi:MAG: hypothetical protein ABJA81_09565, partial [Nocardioidaceae bacterium]
VWTGERGCDAVRGRPSCGGYGLLMLLAILAVCFIIGSLLLRVFGVEDPGVTTFFGVALPLIVILIFLLDYVFSGWMVLALPALAAGCFAVSVILTRALENSAETTYVDDTRKPDRTTGEPAGDEEAETAALPRYAPPEETQPLPLSDRNPEEESPGSSPSGLNR